MTSETPSTERDWMTIVEASRDLDTSSKTIRRMIARGELPAGRLTGPRGRIRIPKAAVRRVRQMWTS